MSVSAGQWRDAAEVLRRKAAEFERLAMEAEAVDGADSIRLDSGDRALLSHLLAQVDGHLGLAIHRGEGPHDQRWKSEAESLKSEARMWYDRLRLPTTRPGGEVTQEEADR